MGNPAVGVIYALVMVAVIVGMDLLFFRHRSWFGSDLRPTSAPSFYLAPSISGFSLVREGRRATGRAPDVPIRPGAQP